MPIADPVKRKEYMKNWHAENIEKRKEYYRLYYQNHKKECLARLQKEREKSPQNHNMINRASRYRIKVKDIYELGTKQMWRCPITDEPLSFGRLGFAIDHDHLSGKVRGLISRNANLLLGYAQDNTRFLGKAITYLNYHKNPPPVAQISDLSESYCALKEQNV